MGYLRVFKVGKVGITAINSGFAGLKNRIICSRAVRIREGCTSSTYRLRSHGLTLRGLRQNIAKRRRIRPRNGNIGLIGDRVAVLDLGHPALHVDICAGFGTIALANLVVRAGKYFVLGW